MCPLTHPRLGRGTSDQSRTTPRVPRPVPDIPEGLQTRSGPPQGSLDPSQTFSSVPQPIPDRRKSPLTRPGPAQGSYEPYRSFKMAPDPSRTYLRVL